MGKNSAIFLEIIEWFDESGDEMVHRIPESGSGAIKYGAQLTVRESQAGVFFYQGKAVGAFGPGRHTLKTGNIPLLTKMASLPWGLTSPLRAEVYFVNLKIFANLKWGTRDPVAFKDRELGVVRLRAFGVFNVQVVQPVLFVNRLVGTQGVYATASIEDYLNRVIVSRFNDYMGENLDTILNLPALYDELSDGLRERLEKDFKAFGLSLTHLYINSITPPQEVQKAIDDRGRMGIFDDLDKLMKMKTAMAMEKAAEGEGAANAGAGLGVAMMMPAMFSRFSSKAEKEAESSETCPECENAVGPDSRFCPHCGHQLVVLSRCAKCGKNLTPAAKYCSRCGSAAESEPEPRFCSQCGGENLPDSLFCNKCGEEL